MNSPLISRYHATLLRITISATEDDIFRIIDGDLTGKRSKNGFKVNDNTCFSYDLQDGDVIINTAINLIQKIKPGQKHDRTLAMIQEICAEEIALLKQIPNIQTKIQSQNKALSLILQN